MAQLLKTLTALAEDSIPVLALRPRGSESVTWTQFPLLASLGTCIHVHIPPHHRHTDTHNLKIKCKDF